MEMEKATYKQQKMKWFSYILLFISSTYTYSMFYLFSFHEYKLDYLFYLFILYAIFQFSLFLVYYFFDLYIEKRWVLFFLKSKKLSMDDIISGMPNGKDGQSNPLFVVGEYQFTTDCRLRRVLKIEKI